MLLAFAVVPHKLYRHQEAFLHMNLCGDCIQSGASLTLSWQLNALALVKHLLSPCGNMQLPNAARC